MVVLRAPATMVIQNTQLHQTDVISFSIRGNNNATAGCHDSCERPQGRRELTICPGHAQHTVDAKHAKVDLMLSMADLIDQLLHPKSCVHRCEMQ